MNEQDNPVVRMYNKINELARTVERLARTIGKRPVASAGTWTPAIDGSTGSPTITYTTQTGHYVKTGRLVQVSFTININTISGGSGQLRISGLPFTSANTGTRTPNQLRTSNVNFSVTPVSIAWEIRSNATDAVLVVTRDNAAITTENIGILAASDVLIGNGVYRAA